MAPRAVSILVYIVLPCCLTAWPRSVPVAWSPAGHSGAQAARSRGIADLDKGNIAEADSLLSAADSMGALDALDFLAWMPAKAALGRYFDAGVLCCKAGVKEPGLAAIACSRLYEMVRDKPAETRRLCLAAYRQCALSREQCDTLRIKEWLSRTYGSLGMFAEETDLLRELDTPHFPSANDFLDAARTRLAMGFAAEAVTPGMEAYRRLPAGAQKSLAATMVYHCFAVLGKTADAALWLPRAQLADARFRSQAAGFLQSAGLLDKADSLISSLPASLVRDTLAVRQALFSGNAERALKLSAALGQDRDAAGIWKIRACVFSGHADSLEGWIDTASPPKDPQYSREQLSYRYKLELLKDAPIALADFGVLEYSLWLGRPAQAPLASVSTYPAPVRRMMVCEVVSALLDKSQVSDASAALSKIPLSETGPEVDFYRGDILVRQGSIAQGSKVLEQIVLSYPDDVFAIKAKSVLAHLARPGQKKNGL